MSRKLPKVLIINEAKQDKYVAKLPQKGTKKPAKKTSKVVPTQKYGPKVPAQKGKTSYPNAKTKPKSNPKNKGKKGSPKVLPKPKGKAKVTIPKYVPKKPECYDDLPLPTTTCEEPPVPTLNDCTKPLNYWLQNTDKITGLTIGSIEYPKKLIIEILWLPGRQNGLVALGKQLIVAKLNYYQRYACSTTAKDIKEADKLIGNKFISANGKDSLSQDVVCDLVKRLQTCNKGGKKNLNCTATTTTTTPTM